MEYKCASFIKLLLLFLSLFILNNCFAQQRIIFLKKIKGNKEMQHGQAYYLPRTVGCKINDLPSQKLILESIHGDTFYFKKTTSDSIEIKCNYSNIKFIQFINKNHFLYQTIAASSIIASGFLMNNGIIFYKMRSSISVYEHYKIALYGIASLTCFTIGATINYKLPQKIKHEKYSLIVE